MHLVAKVGEKGAFTFPQVVPHVLAALCFEHLGALVRSMGLKTQDCGKINRLCTGSTDSRAHDTLGSTKSAAKLL